VRPRVVLHIAVSADGRVDRVTPDVALFYELARRWQEDATLVGADTLLAAAGPDQPDEDPEPLPAPAPGDERPLLAAVDSRGRARAWHAWLAAGHWRAGVALCSRATPTAHLDYLAALGVERLVAGDERVDLAEALEWLAARHGVRTVRVDSGGTLNRALLRAGLVDEVSVLVHPALVGAATEAIAMSLEAVERVGDDVVWLRYRL
jgi:2,5-diamino-6-(ribosylamino)-4(3H)-pyrimidinone 5'-phosphate reductase